MSSFLQRTIEPRNLFDAFETVRRSDEADGRSTRQLLKMLSDPSAHLDNLAGQLTTGAYRPEPLWRVDIADGEDSTRSLSIPSFTDRVVERAIYQVLVPELDAEFFPSPFGYRVGIGVDDAVGAIAEARDRGGYLHVARFDFENCFENIDRNRLVEMLSEVVDDEWLLDLIGKLLTRTVANRRGRPALDGLAQGSPLSPLLANFYLHKFDEAMFRRGFRVIRYADDATVLSFSKSEASYALRSAQVEAGNLGLTLNEEETTVADFDQGFDFLGVDFSRRIPPWDEDRELTTPSRRSLFVTEQNSYLALQRGQVIVLSGDVQLMAAPISLIRQIVVFGRVQMSPWLRTQALSLGIELVFLSRTGRYLGSAAGDRHSSDDVLPAQLAAIAELGVTVALSRRFVAGKIANMRALMVRRGQATSATEEILVATQKLAAARRRVLRATNLDVIRGIEGSATKRYWKVFGGLLGDNANFEGRSRRPPRDPVNSLLSFGYAVLLPEVEGACRTAGLDPRYGFLHPVGRNRPAMALDLIEEFRTLIVDTTVLTAFNRGIIKPDRDFKMTKAGACRISNDEARKAFLGALEKRMLTRFAHTPSGVRTSYRRALHLQSRQLATVLLGLRTQYDPVMWR